MNVFDVVFMTLEGIYHETFWFESHYFFINNQS